MAKRTRLTPEMEETIVSLYVNDGLGYRRIAKRMGIKESAVESAVSRLRANKLIPVDAQGKNGRPMKPIAIDPVDAEEIRMVYRTSRMSMTELAQIYDMDYRDLNMVLRVEAKETSLVGAAD
jgi:transposase-like protein